MSGDRSPFPSRASSRSPTRGRGLTDVALVVVLVAGATVALLLPGVPRQIRWALGVPFVLLLPGYVIVAALFPARPTIEQTAGPESPGWPARFGLSLVGSGIVVAVVGVALSVGGVLRLVPVVLTLAAITGVGALATWIRRRGVDAPTRADPFGVVSLRGLSGRLGLSTLQTVTFGVAVIALVGAVAYAGGTPMVEDPYSEVSLLGGEDSETLLGANDTVTLQNGAENAVSLRLENHEGQSTTYGIVGQVQRIGPDGTVLETQEVDRGQITVADGETVVVDRRIDPGMTGDAIRLRYLVYEGSIPDDPGAENADLVVRHWIEVSEGDST